MDDAVRHWKLDLKFLHNRYYVGKFHFGWPSTVVEGLSSAPSLGNSPR